VHRGLVLIVSSAGLGLVGVVAGVLLGNFWRRHRLR
jgi:hypothetical protein